MDGYASHLNRPTLSEAEYERIVDLRVCMALYSDPRYKHAANAEEQSEAEEAIEREVERELNDKYLVAV